MNAEKLCMGCMAEDELQPPDKVVQDISHSYRQYRHK